MKNTVQGLFAATSMVALSAPAQAQTRPGFEVTAEIFDYAYREEMDDVTIVSDDGLFGGAAVTYVETVGGGLFLRGRLGVALGSVDYRSDEGSTIDDVAQSTGQLELHLGYDIPVGGGATLTPFAGLGSRALIDESGGKVTSDGLAGYDRTISYGYIPLGAAASVPLGQATSLLISAQYNWLVHGRAKSEFSDVAPALPDITLDLDSGHGFETSAVVAFPLAGGRMSVGPFIRGWRIEQSRSVTVTDPQDPTTAVELFEPRNRTTEIGVRIGFAF